MKFSYQFSNLCGTVYKQGNVLFTPDGNCVLSPVGNRITLFDLVNHKSATFPFENRRNIIRIALSPDGRLLISVDEKGVALLINYRKRVVLCEFRFGVVRDIQFSPDSKYIAATAGRKIKMWKAPPLVYQFQPFHLHREYSGNDMDVTCISWSCDSDFFATGAKDCIVRIYARDKYPLQFQKTGRHDVAYTVLSLVAHRSKIVATNWGPGKPWTEGSTLYSVDEGGALFVWKCQSIEYKQKEDHAGTYQKREGGFHNNPKNFNDNKNYILEKKHFFKTGSNVMCSAFRQSKGLSFIIVGFKDGMFGLYELPDCTLIHQLSISKQMITSVDVNESGEWLVFGCRDIGQLLVWEWQSETYVLKQQGHFFDVNTICYSPDGQLMISGGDDGKVKIWNTTNGFCFITFANHTAPVTAVECSKTGTVIFSASQDGTVRAYDLVRYRNFRTFTSPTPVQFTCLTIGPNGDFVCAGAQDPFEIYVWALQTGKLLDILTGHEGPISGIAFSGSLSILVSSSWDGTVKIWDVLRGKDLIETLNHSTKVLTLAVSPNGKEVCSSTQNGNLYFWNIDDARLRGIIEGKKDIMGGRRFKDFMASTNSTYSSYFSSVCYSADGTCVLAGGNSKYICIYKINQRLLVKKFIISKNMSLDGMKKKLNSRGMTALTNLNDIDSDYSSDEDPNEETLPGVKRSDYSKRKTALIARSKCVKFSPTGLHFSVASVEGLLIYSLEDSMVFEPSLLNMETTPDAVFECLNKNQYSNALNMALCLNEEDLIKTVLAKTKLTEIPMVVNSVASLRLQRLLSVLVSELQDSPHLEFYMSWLHCILLLHSSSLRRLRGRLLTTARALHKALTQQYNDISKLCNENQYLLDYLSSAVSFRTKNTSIIAEDTKVKENITETKNKKTKTTTITTVTTTSMTVQDTEEKKKFITKSTQKNKKEKYKKYKIGKNRKLNSEEKQKQKN